MKRQSLMRSVDQQCKQCIYAKLSPDTWRPQTTLCAIENCPLWRVLPKTFSPISIHVLRSSRPESALFQTCVDITEVRL